MNKRIYLCSFIVILMVHHIVINHQFVNKSSKKSTEVSPIFLKHQSVSIVHLQSKENLEEKNEAKNVKKIKKKNSKSLAQIGVLSLKSGSNFKIIYPYLSQLNFEQGLVSIKIFVDAYGKLVKYKFIKKSKYKRLNKEVLRVVNSVEYQKVKINNHFVRSVGIKEFSFKLR